MMRHLQIPRLEYAKIATIFNPVKFDADEWVQLALNAGMKYMIITAKHHDGFAMFNSASNDYNIVNRSPWRRDPIKELAEASRRKGLKFGVYYSLGRDWDDPDVPTNLMPDGSTRTNFWDFPDESIKDFSRYFERKVKPQIRELLTQYGDIDVLWFDTPEIISTKQSIELLRLIHSIQPKCIVNQRIGNRYGDYRVEEQNIPVERITDPWETCMTLNRHWGYYLGDENWKSLETVVRNLIDIVSKDGNFLLNVGPTGEGVIPAGSVERLRETGKWLALNGEAIYGASGSPIGRPDWGRVTQNTTKNTIYLHVFDWPTDGKLSVNGLDTENIASAKLLTTNQPLNVSAGSRGVTLITLPTKAPDNISSTIILTMKSLADINCAPKPPNEGWTRWEPTYRLQNWTIRADNERFWDHGNNNFTTMLEAGDARPPGTPGGNRVELRWPDWIDQEAEHMMEADVMYESGTHGTCLMQIKTNQSAGGGGNASIYLVVREGDLFHGVNRRVIIEGGYDKWHNIKVAYNPANGLARVWINDELKFHHTYLSGAGASWYFKNGAYWAAASSKVHFKNLSFWVNPVKEPKEVIEANRQIVEERAAARQKSVQ